jgi:GntR family transcriptional regulator
MEEEGLIVRKRGKGTFVSEKARIPNSPKLSGYIEDIIYMGIQTDVKVIGSCWVKPDSVVSEALQLDEAEEALRLEKIRLVEDSPFSHVLNYLPPDIGKKIQLDKIAEKPMLMILEDNLGIKVAEAVQTVEADVADAEVAGLLEVRVGEPLLKLERIVFDVKKKPVEYVSALYRADRYSFTVNLTRNRLGGTGGWEPV